MLKLHLCGRSNRHHNLVSRVQLICDNHNVSLLKYVFDNTYANHCKYKIKAFKTSDGIIDSAAHLLTDFNAHNRVVTPVAMALLFYVCCYFICAMSVSVFYMYCTSPSWGLEIN